jgi:hypothetical protein
VLADKFRGEDLVRISELSLQAKLPDFARLLSAHLLIFLQPNPCERFHVRQKTPAAEAWQWMRVSIGFLRASFRMKLSWGRRFQG